jgi:hypothetical protein
MIGTDESCTMRGFAWVWGMALQNPLSLLQNFSQQFLVQNHATTTFDFVF